VDRASADVTEDDAERSDGQCDLGWGSRRHGTRHTRSVSRPCTMADMPRRAMTVLATVAILGLSIPAAAADEARLVTFTLDGHQVVGVLDVPEVGSFTEVREYHDRGTFDADRAMVAEAASARLAQEVLERCSGDARVCRELRLAIVVDIDDTLVD